MSTVAPFKSITTPVKDKLDESGLTLADAKALGIEPLTRGQTADLHPAFQALQALKINYYDHLGQPLPDRPASAPFYRIRYLEEPPPSFADVGEKKKKPLRYTQPPGTLPVAYFPRSIPWAPLVTDTSLPIIITEGELKAAKACKEGFPTIGLGGVSNWRAMKAGVTWLPSFAPIDWRMRHTYLVFDSDYRTNPMVMAALLALSEALHNRGAIVYIVSLPALPGLDKTGLDDFLVHAGPDANKLFQDVLAKAIPFGLTRTLWELNDTFVHINKPSLLIERKTKEKYTTSEFSDGDAGIIESFEQRIKANGDVTYKSVSAATKWLKWPLRLGAKGITYRPGAPEFVEGMSLYNTWAGWGVDPVPGDVGKFQALIHHLFSNLHETDPAALEWFLRWCAYPLQHPGTKLASAVVLHGIRHGTGKSLLGYTLGRIYGKNFAEIGGHDLHSGFNDWAEGRQFVMGDDVTGSNKREDANHLKKLITQQELRVNIKYIPSYTVPDCVNYYFTANHPDAFFIEDYDRRFFVHEVKAAPLDDAFYRTYTHWLDEEGGAAHVFDWLLKLPLGEFLPKAPAYKTEGLRQMIFHGKSDLACWVHDLKDAPEHTLRIGDIQLTRDIFTARELLMLYDPNGSTRTIANAMGKALKTAGVPLAGGRQLTIPGKPINTWYVFRNFEYWTDPKRTGTDVLVHLRKHVDPISTGKY